MARLIVDDAMFMHKVLAGALSAAGHEIVGDANNGDEGVALFRKLSPDLVMPDITMPVKDGLQTLAEIRTINPAPRVVMCSALGQESKVVQALKLGAKDFVAKPFTTDRVVEAANNALA